MSLQSILKFLGDHESKCYDKDRETYKALIITAYHYT